MKNPNNGREEGFLFAMGEDGKEWKALNLPVIDKEKYHWQYHPAPSGGLIAFRVVSQSMPSLQEPDLNGWIYLLKLPENRVIQKLPMFREDAWAAMNHKDSGLEEFQLSMLLLRDQTLEWSPDGRYLAYIYAVDGTQTQISLYDTFEDSIRPLVKEPGWTVPLSWTPDSETLLYQELASYDGENLGLIISVFQGTHRVSLDGIKELLYPTEKMEAVLWLDENYALVYDIGLEGYKCNLRELNLRTGFLKQVEKGCFSGIAGSPIKQEYLLGLSSNAYLMFEDSGVYRVNQNTLERRKLLSCIYCFIQYQKEIPYIQVGLEEEGEVILFASSGKEVTRLPGRFNDLYPSPDGGWLVTSSQEHPQLLDRSFHVAQDLTMSPNQKPIWRSDSSGFFTTMPGSMLLYEQANDWEPKTIRSVDNLYLEWFVVQP